MSMENFDDTFLARWIAGEASPEEEAMFKNHPDYTKYQKIKKVSDKLSFEEFNEDTSFEKLKEKLEVKKETKKTRPLYKWGMGIAASIAILIGLFVFNNKETTYSSAIAQQQNITLPDGSIMVLNAATEAKVNTESWDVDRCVSLHGEAFFKVKKGSKFTVKTSLGNVEVLGTQFTVNTVNKDLITVKCFEGKVKVTNKTNNVILTKGMAFQQHKNTVNEWVFEKTTPHWLASKETNLYKTPVAEVITLLKRQYNLKIQQQEHIDKTLLFTGSFTNTDLNKALYSVFGTLNINYELITDNEIRILLE